MRNTSEDLIAWLVLTIDYITYMRSVLQNSKPGKREFNVTLKILKGKQYSKTKLGHFKPGPMLEMLTIHTNSKPFSSDLYELDPSLDMRTIQANSKSNSSGPCKPGPMLKVHNIQTDTKSYRSRSSTAAGIPLISLELFPQGLKLPTKISSAHKEWFLGLFQVDYSLQSLSKYKQHVSRSGNSAPLSFDNLFKYLDLLHWVSAAATVDDEKLRLTYQKIWSVFQNQFPMLLHNDIDSQFLELAPDVLKRVSEIVLQVLNNNSFGSTIELTMQNYITYIYEPILSNMATNLVFFDDSVDILQQLVDSFIKIVGCCLLAKLGLLQSSETLRDSPTLRRLEQVVKQRASTSPTQVSQLLQLKDLFITPVPYFSTPLNLQKFVSQTNTEIWLRLAKFYLSLMQRLVKLLWKIKPHWSLTDEFPYIVARSRLKILAFMLALEDTELMAFYLNMHCWGK